MNVFIVHVLFCCNLYYTKSYACNMHVDPNMPPMQLEMRACDQLEESGAGFRV